MVFFGLNCQKSHLKGTHEIRVTTKKKGKKSVFLECDKPTVAKNATVNRSRKIARTS